MGFTTYSFPIFILVLLIVYYTVPRNHQWKVLLLASYYFYLTHGFKLLVFILFTTLTVFICANIIGHKYDAQDSYLKKHRNELSKEERRDYKKWVKADCRRLLCICLFINFGLLLLCKTCLIDPFRTIASHTPLTFLTIALPLGISFYMFQAAGYLVDVYRRTISPEYNLFRFALFLSYFPQLIQGPISRFKALNNQLCEEHSFSSQQLSFGLQRILWGYFKKLVIADRIAIAVTTLRGPEYTGIGFLLLGTYYAVQIYCDFTGGMDIAIGVSECLGIKLPENFNHPFFSKNTAEYWRRWHMTLGDWMKDYIFYPVSMSAPLLKITKYTRSHFGYMGKRIPVYISSGITWIVTGIWHGITPNFILWGMLNFLVIMISQELQPIYERFHKTFHLNERSWYDTFQILRMFLLMNVIRSCDLFSDVSEYFLRICSLIRMENLQMLWDGTLLQLGLMPLDYFFIVSGLIAVTIVSTHEERNGSVRVALNAKPKCFRYGVFYILFLLVLLAGQYGIGYSPSNFIYDKF